MSENIILIGFMAAGKDTVGRVLARQTGRSFLSTDELIELRENRTISEIFNDAGEGYFRRLEREILEKIKDVKNTVIATGGGIVLDRENRELLLKMGKVVHLYADLDTLKMRLAQRPERPLIKKPTDIERILKERKGKYDFACLKIDVFTKNPPGIADEIIKRLKIREDLHPLPLKKIMINCRSGHYPVYIGAGIFNGEEADSLFSKKGVKKGTIITNPFVGALYLDRVIGFLERYDLEVRYFTLPDGESYKNLDIVSLIYEFLLKNNTSRFEPLIALGGGVVGDLTGFVASTYKRGMPFIQVPTTLLAQIDASIGGKNGVNHRYGKNVIGTFYQPEMVIVDVNFLQSLPDREFRNGIAEMIKYGLTADQELFYLLEENREKILKRDVCLLAELVVRSIKIKSGIVEEDEKELKGKREILNFGHSIGHAIEMLSGYSRFSHGEAVAIGMVEESRIAVARGFLKQEKFERIKEILESYGLPAFPPAGLKKDDIRDVLYQDKKVKGGYIRVPFLMDIGRVELKEVLCKDFL